jgi:hypothetical protein
MRIDANAYLGHWPYRRLAHDGLEGLRRVGRLAGLDHIIVGNLSGAFYLDPRDANEEALEELGNDPLFSYTPVVNPARPWWERDLQWAVDSGCKAIRVFPNYWGIGMADPPGDRLMAAIREAGIGLVVNIRLHDERHHQQQFYKPPVQFRDLEWLVRQWLDVPILLAAGAWRDIAPIGASAIRDSRLVVDVSYVKTPTFVIEEMVEAIGADHIAFGTGAPLHYPEVATYRVEMADISDEDRAAIWGGTIAHAFGLKVESGSR